ncbi:MAG: 50S ribosomal protein L29 [Candidatus Dormibacteria bacterium]
MKRDELAKLRDLTEPELAQKARETKETLFNLRFQLRTGHLSDFSRVRAVKREYAAIATVISEKRLAARTAASEAKHGAA